MNIENINTTNGDTLIKLSGEMDALGCTTIRQDLEDLAKQQNPHTILDIKEITFIDSSGIGAIVFLFKRLKAQGRTLEIIGVQGQPQELMKLLRIDTAIPLTHVDNTSPQEV